MTLLPTPSALIALRGVGVERGGRWLVQGVDLTLERGKVVTLIGPNGSGKSTTAKVVTGVIKPTRGQVARQAGLTIGYVPQKLTLDWTMPLTVKRLMTLTGAHRPADIEAALDQAGARHLLDAGVQDLSGGEFQRVLFARAVVRKPDVLVLDEPVQGVDSAGEVALYELIGQIRDTSRAGILLISHDLHVVMAGTDTVLCLNGHVCCTGSPESVAKSPEYLRMFGPRASQALAIYQHHHDHTHGPDGALETGHTHDQAHDHHV